MWAHEEDVREQSREREIGLIKKDLHNKITRQTILLNVRFRERGGGCDGGCRVSVMSLGVVGVARTHSHLVVV